MVSAVLIGIWFALLVYQIYKWMVFKPKNFPPGPPRLPIFGSYPILLLLSYRHLHKAVDWLCKYYKTDVLGLYAGPYPVVVANSVKTVRELLNDTAMDGKPPLKLAQLRSPDFILRGILTTQDELWHEQRRYTLRYLRDYGLGCRHKELESELNDELLTMIDLIRYGPKFDFEKKVHNGDSVLIPDIFPPIFGNVFMKVFLNERLPREKYHLMYEAAEYILEFGRNGDAWGRLLSMVDWIPKVFPKLSGYDILRENAMKYYDAIEAIVNEQYKTYDPSHERHFVDMYFKKIEETEGDPKSTYSYKQLVHNALDLFFAAFVTETVQFHFLMQRLCWQPEIVKKCQDELDKVVGHSRLPTLDDRVHLPYVEATLRESIRYDTINPSGLPHTALADTKINGYDIPKGTIAFPAPYGAHRDESFWDEPNLYKPERFLDENGQFSVKLDNTFAFGLGKRVCVGETFARNTMFLVLAAIVQNFNITVPDNEKLPTESETVTGFFRYPPKYRLKFVPR